MRTMSRVSVGSSCTQDPSPLPSQSPAPSPPWPSRLDSEVLEPATTPIVGNFAAVACVCEWEEAARGRCDAETGPQARALACLPMSGKWRTPPMRTGANGARRQSQPLTISARAPTSGLRHPAEAASSPLSPGSAPRHRSDAGGVPCQELHRYARSDSDSLKEVAP